MLLVRAENPLAQEVLVGAGDIAVCGSNKDEATANLLDQIVASNPGAMVFTTGDNVYPSGTYNQFLDCYEPSWGRHKAWTRPSPGNHDYRTDNAAGYFAYFGANAGPANRGYYSYDLGSWHIVSLNSNIHAGPAPAQLQWLRDDLAANQSECTLAYWHHPPFSSGPHSNDPYSQTLFEALYQAGADVVVNGHDHSYERFAPQNPSGGADPLGIPVFVVGTGGAGLRPFDDIKPNSVARNDTAHGVLKFTLKADSYSWEFVPIAGETFSDSGSASCSIGSPHQDPLPVPEPQPEPESDEEEED